jgi:hypothetical protein
MDQRRLTRARRLWHAVVRPSVTTVRAMSGALLAAAAIACSPSGTHSAHTHRLTLRFIAVLTAVNDRDAPPRGPSRGDRITSTDRLINAQLQLGRAAHSSVGSDRTDTLIKGPATGVVTGVARLPGGTVSFGGPVHGRTAGGYSVSVRGGTGVFTSVTGKLLVRGGPKVALNTYQLDLKD